LSIVGETGLDHHVKVSNKTPKTRFTHKTGNQMDGRAPYQISEYSW